MKKINFPSAEAAWDFAQFANDRYDVVFYVEAGHGDDFIDGVEDAPNILYFRDYQRADALNALVEKGFTGVYDPSIEDSRMSEIFDLEILTMEYDAFAPLYQ